MTANKDKLVIHVVSVETSLKLGGKDSESKCFIRAQIILASVGLREVSYPNLQPVHVFIMFLAKTELNTKNSSLLEKMSLVGPLTELTPSEFKSRQIVIVSFTGIRVNKYSTLKDTRNKIWELVCC